jgi:hypothetical protein
LLKSSKKNNDSSSPYKIVGEKNDEQREKYRERERERKK